jgi:hypothetical protein
MVRASGRAALSRNCWRGLVAGRDDAHTPAFLGSWLRGAGGRDGRLHATGLTTNPPDGRLGGPVAAARLPQSPSARVHGRR